jgi:hypothetical protein
MKRRPIWARLASPLDLECYSIQAGAEALFTSPVFSLPKDVGIYVAIWCSPNTLKSPQILFLKNTLPWWRVFILAKNTLEWRGFVGISRDYPLKTPTSKQSIRKILRYEIISSHPLKYPRSKQGLKKPKRTALPWWSSYFSTDDAFARLGVLYLAALTSCFIHFVNLCLHFAHLVTLELWDNRKPSPAKCSTSNFCFIFPSC